MAADAMAYGIHRRSSRADQPFVYVSCIFDDPEKLDADVFGTAKTLGYINKASNGTLFLEDVLKLGKDSQRKLMTFLHGGKYLIGNRPVSCFDVRIICSATAESMQQALSNDSFSRELFYRLNIAEINIPNIKDRREDIPHLIEYYLSKSEQLFGLQKKKFTDNAMTILQAYDWPGNMHQMKNVIESSLINASDGNESLIQEHHLPAELMYSAQDKFESLNIAKLISLPLKEAKEAFESDYLQAQIEKFCGNISHTANFIGMERSALHRKLRTLNIVRHKKNAD
jgi:two-component system nitrogen regulation response regulator NtrX